MAGTSRVFAAEYIKMVVTGNSIRLIFDIDKSFERVALEVLGSVVGDGSEYGIAKLPDVSP